jgi:hypothetical protein
LRYHDAAEGWDPAGEHRWTQNHTGKELADHRGLPEALGENPEGPSCCEQDGDLRDELEYLLVRGGPEGLDQTCAPMVVKPP